MRLKNGTTVTAAGVTALALTLSVSLLTGCSGNDSPASSATPAGESANGTSPARTTNATNSAPPSSTSVPSTQAPLKSPEPSAPAAGVPAQKDGSPNSFMSFEPQAPITTPEQAIEVMKKAMNYNPDLVYDASPNKYGNFDVKVRSRALMNQGGSGTAGIWEVTSDGSHAEKSAIIR